MTLICVVTLVKVYFSYFLSFPLSITHSVSLYLSLSLLSLSVSLPLSLSPTPHLIRHARGDASANLVISSALRSDGGLLFAPEEDEEEAEDDAVSIRQENGEQNTFVHLCKLHHFSPMNYHVAIHVEISGFL